MRIRFVWAAWALLSMGAVAACSGAAPVGTTPNESGGVEEDPPAGEGDDGGSSPGNEAGPDAAKDTGKPGPATPDGISMIVEPTDNAQALLDAVNAATKSIHVTMYLLTDTRFIEAFIAQHQAGRDVKIVLNKTFPGGAGSNSSVYNQLTAAGVSVKWAPSTFTYTHEKCVILDAKTAWIMTMNLTKSAPTSNREFLAIDGESGDVAEAEAIFEADYAGTALNNPQGNAVVAPINAKARIVDLIKSAKESLLVEGEELGDYQVVNSLIAARQAGLEVKVVLSDATPSASQASSETALKNAQIELVKVKDPYIHAKAIVADEKAAYVGSANFTAVSMQQNRELGVITTNADSVASVTQTIRADFAIGQ